MLDFTETAALAVPLSIPTDSWNQLAMEWTGWDILLEIQHLNPWPPACKAGDLPLIYRPIPALTQIWRLVGK